MERGDELLVVVDVGVLWVSELAKMVVQMLRLDGGLGLYCEGAV